MVVDNSKYNHKVGCPYTDTPLKKNTFCLVCGEGDMPVVVPPGTVEAMRHALKVALAELAYISTTGKPRNLAESYRIIEAALK